MRCRSDRLPALLAKLVPICEAGALVERGDEPRNGAARAAHRGGSDRGTCWRGSTRRSSAPWTILFACKGRVVVTGMGKSGLIGRKIAATFSSTGTPSVFLHPAEALHGDLGMLLAGDVVLAISYGGETEEIVALLATIKRLALPLVTLTGNPRSTLAAASDVVLDVSVREEACSLNLAPTASTTAAMAMGDALAVALLDRRGFSHDDFAALHPGGRLGKKLLRVRDLMHAGDAMPRVAPEAKIPDVIYEISKQGPGHDHGGGRATARWPESSPTATCGA